MEGRLILEIDNDGRPRYFPWKRGVLLGNDGRVYSGRKRIRWTGEWWYVNIGHHSNPRQIRRDKLNSPRELETLRWRLLIHISNFLVPRLGPAATMLKETERPHFYDNAGRLWNVRSDDYGVHAEQPKAVDDIVDKIASIPVDKDGLLAGTNWHRCSQAIHRAWASVGTVGSALARSMALHARAFYPNWNQYDRASPSMFFIINGRRYTHGNDRRNADGWPHPSDILINLDDPTMALDKTTIHVDYQKTIKNPLAAPPSVLFGAKEGIECQHRT
jgi:hypothetical protein